MEPATLATPRSRLRVLIVDDHTVLREGLVDALAVHPDLEVCGEAASVGAGLALAALVKPDLVIVDLTLGRESGFDLLRGLRTLDSAPAALVLSMHDEAFYADQALALGARGYLMKSDADGATLATALREVAAGGVYVGERLRRRLVERALSEAPGSPAQVERLSERERRVLLALARGLSSKEIGLELGATAKTIDSHRRNIRLKLGIDAPEDLRRVALLLASQLSDARSDAVG